MKTDTTLPLAKTDVGNERASPEQIASDIAGRFFGLMMSEQRALAEKIAKAIRTERSANDALVKALEAILAEHDRVPFSYPTMPCVKDARSLLARLRGDKCPRCESSDPARHPAVQFEGEVRFCPHPFHSREQGGE